MIPQKQIRALYNENTIRVYQAYSSPIADSALEAQTFVSPPFKMERMTWIKPSFLWMMYRAGYGLKDDGQKRILAIDITHAGFRWALEHSCGSHIPDGMTREDWKDMKANTPVRIQWDPERDLRHNPLPHRSIQIGLSGDAVQNYVKDMIVRVEDITPIAHRIHAMLEAGDDEQAQTLCPQEQVYDLIQDHGQYG